MPRNNYSPADGALTLDTPTSDDMKSEVASMETPFIGASISRAIPADCVGMRVDRALAKMFPEHSRSRIASRLKSGHILLDGRHVSPDEKVWGHELVELQGENLAPVDPSVVPPAAEAIDLKVVFEDETVLVIDKPAGLVVHPGSGNWSGTLLNALLHYAPQVQDIARAGIVHRLDKDTSGLLVVAKTQIAQTSLVRQLQSRSVERIYLALVHGRVERDGEVEAPIGRDPHNRVRMAVSGSGRPALTRYQVRQRYVTTTLLECRLSTGRTHQIRVHLQSIGHPLVGDPVYRRAASRGGPNAVSRFTRQALHATRLAFLHPIGGERVEFESPLPEDMRQLLDSLG
ncbi:MAG: RluA family pseudouridine synthase [Burkholderiales bacterium]